jgi:DNA polymerase III alpha subunit (gram-positive type)
LALVTVNFFFYLEASRKLSSPCSSNQGNEEITNLYESSLNRNIVLVGHDVAADIKYLRELGYNPYELCNLQELVDTSFMYRAFRRESQPRNLGSILVDLGIAGWDLHNAGNDAMYTLQAMVSIALRAKLEKQDKESRGREKMARLEE